VLIGLVVVAAILLAVWGLRGSGEPEVLLAGGETASPSAAVSSAPAATGDPSECALPEPGPDGDVGPDTPLKVDAWEYAGTGGLQVGYPTSTRFGPGVVSATGVRSCFQHSPAGAVMASASWSVQVNELATLQEWLTAVTAGPGRDAVLALVESYGTDVSSGVPNVLIELRGFKVLSYDGERALVELAEARTTEGRVSYYAVQWDMRWLDGDWRMWVGDAESPEIGHVVEVPRFGRDYLEWS
jgi:hypothetical protein